MSFLSRLSDLLTDARLTSNLIAIHAALVGIVLISIIIRRLLTHGGNRLIAWTGPLISGWLIANFGGFSRAAVMIACIYILSLIAAPFLPETRGKPLPE